MLLSIWIFHRFFFRRKTTQTANTERHLFWRYPTKQPTENRNNNKQQTYKSKMAAWNNKQNKQKIVNKSTNQETKQNKIGS